jgi:hypothetical protein
LPRRTTQEFAIDEYRRKSLLNGAVADIFLELGQERDGVARYQPNTPPIAIDAIEV